MEHNEKFCCCKYCENYKLPEYCKNCDGNTNFKNPKKYLQIQNVIKNKYIINKVISFNSEGVTYLAYDINLEKRYFVREYMPDNLAYRDYSSSNIIFNNQKEAQYKALMVDFTDLYKTLLLLKNMPGIIPIIDIFTENNTVYVVEEYIDLISLNNYLNQLPSKSLSWYKCKPIFLKLNSILSKVHRQGLIHRGISPYNIYLDQSLNPYVNGFCISCVRTAESELQEELYDGYSAPEQYQTDGWQGTWTDVYGLASTLYTVLTGQKLKNGKLKIDDVNLLLEKNKFIIPNEIAVAISKAVKYNHKNRTQTIEQFNIELIDEDFVSNKTTIYNTSDLKNSNLIKSEKKMKKNKNVKIIIIGVILLAVFLCVIFGISIFKSITGTSKVEKINEEYIEKNPWLFDDVSEPEKNVDEQEKFLGSSNGAIKQKNKPLTTLPNFVGEQIKDIKRDNLYSKLNFIVEEEYSESNIGEVIQQEPLPGVSLKVNKLDVILKISKGPDFVEVPDIIGKQIEEAKHTLDELQIKYEIVEVYDKSYKEGVVNQISKNIGDKIIKNKEPLILRVKSSQLTSSSVQTSSKNSNTSNNATVQEQPYITEE